jgi:hypothetical protein
MVNSYRLTLLLAGAVSTGVIAFGASLAHPGRTPWPLLLAALLATYALGLGIGWLIGGGMAARRTNRA